ncbi:13999_t:CDS:10 [Acaulospora morrowiae]|uniref:13999_t:CDS:1 n=1 Tax=Acaulospora morrowiae TaxID=94023 RepID=A0A9N8ZCY1_9GLOM|nr:13999_t:CDS:10 [Acaulospora morrowiae]
MYDKSSDSLFIIILFILFIINLDFTTADDYNRLVFNEPDTSFRIYEVETYRDGTTVVLLSKSINDTCVEPILHVRVVHPNGEMTSSDIPTQIPDFNFCLGDYGRRNPSSYGLRVYSSVDGILLVTYFNTSDVTQNPSVYGLTISFEGNILWNNYIGAGYVNGTKLMYPNKIEISKFNPLSGMFRSELRMGSNKVDWFFYNAPDAQGKFDLVNGGSISVQSLGDDAYLQPFHTIDGGYGIIIAYTSNDHSSTETQLSMYAIFIQPVTGTVSDTHLVYSNSFTSLDVSDISCAVDYNSQGQVCFVVATGFQKTVFGIELTFLPSGISNSSQQLDINLANVVYTFTEPLFLGGKYSGSYLFVTEDTSGVVNGYLFDSQGKNVMWKLPSLTVEGTGRRHGVFKNNTVVAVTRDYATSSAWNLFSTELSNFTSSDHGYYNPTVLSTTPSIRGTTKIGTTLLSIKFNIPVQLSEKNVSIYMKGDINSGLILREVYSGQSGRCYLSELDNTTLMLNTLESTFNRPGAVYYVTVDDNFTISAESRRPLIGVPPDFWNFQTETIVDLHSDQKSGLVRLTASGTKYFQTLSSIEKNAFLLKLRDQLSAIAPVKADRLSPNEKYQMSAGYSGSQIMFSFKISPDSNDTGPNVPRVINDLDTLIRNKWITAGNNLIILRTTLFVFDFCIDLTFLLKDGRTVENLWVPTLMLFIVPKVSNVILSSVIIYREFYKNSLFYSWLTEFPQVFAIIIPLSPIRVECLKIINSRIARFDVLRAPLSSKSENLIFWSVIFAFLIEDIPQLIVQLLYLTSTIQYDLIALLALISCIITILQIIIMIVWKSVKNKKKMYHLEKLGDDDKSLGSTLHPSDESTQTMNDSKIAEKMSIKFSHETMDHDSDTYVPRLDVSEQDETLLRYNARVLRRGISHNDFGHYPYEVQIMDMQPRPKSWNDIIGGSSGELEDDETIIIKENESIKKVSVIENNVVEYNEQKGVVLTVGNQVIPEVEENAFSE